MTGQMTTGKSPSYRKMENRISDLEAEIERLKDRIDKHHRMFEPMCAEIERLQKLVTEQGQEIAITRERDELLEALNAELVAALKEIELHGGPAADHARAAIAKVEGMK